MPRRIAHLDMDAFYASVELLRYPELRGQPVVIGGRRTSASAGEPARRFDRLRDYVGRGVVTTSTYEARALGVFSGMGVMKAARLAPEAILLPADFQAYRHYSRLFKVAVAAIAPQIEDRGIDEIYIDLTHIEEDTESLAGRIKHAVREATGLSCSIGISPNKLLSKLASELDKPDGLTILNEADIPRRIWPLPVRKINGIGPRADEKLAALSMVTIADLAKADERLLQEHFGRAYSAWLHRVAHGIDDRPVVTQSEPKSMSREMTFERDLHPRADRDMLSAIFTDLCMRVAEDLQRRGYAGRTVSIKLRYEDFHTVTRDLTVAVPTADPLVIRKAAGECLRRVPLQQRLRLLGVRVSALSTGDVLPPREDSTQGELSLGQ
jgi:DNA polymerase-4